MVFLRKGKKKAYPTGGLADDGHAADYSSSTASTSRPASCSAAAVMVKSSGSVDDHDHTDLPTSPPLLTRLTRRKVDVGDESLAAKQVCRSCSHNYTLLY